MSVFNSSFFSPRVPCVPCGLILVFLFACANFAGAESKPEIKAKSATYIVVGKPTVLTFYGENLTPKEIKANKPGVIVKLGAMKATEGEDKKKGSRQVAVELTPAANSPLENVELTFVEPDGGKTTAQISLVDGAAAEMPEKKPSGTFAQAMPLTLTAAMPSVAISGNVENDTPSTFKFEAKMGETWQFHVFAGRGGSTLDPVARLRDSRHISLALAVGPPNKDRTLTFTALTAGTYYLEIMDEQSRGGGGFTYRLTARTGKR